MASSSTSPSAKPQFWRIQNIKASQRAIAQRWLYNHTREPGLYGDRGFSLAADGENSLCATLTSYTQPVPASLGWSIDKHFHGMTTLYDPGNAEVDIVAVTGLGGHALGSFRSSSGSTAWLRDFMPNDLPWARAITYGYDTTLTGSVSIQSISDLAKSFLDALDVFRTNTNTQRRPLCFVCHSLGGIVVKEALRVSGHAREGEHSSMHDVVASTCGLVLFGVPNLGLNHVQLMTLVGTNPNRILVQDLMVQDSEPRCYLRHLTEGFARLCKRREPPWKIVSYYELNQSSTLAVSISSGPP